MNPRVTLLSYTKEPLQTLWLVWESSRRADSLEKILQETDFNDKQSFANFFSRIIREEIPVAEMVDFVFLLDGVSISLREQLVRHRVGVKIGPGLGVDQIPDLADSSFWSQSMRILDMGRFATQGNFLIPETIANSAPAQAIYRTAMLDAEAAYRSLAGLNIPLEDARQLIPLGATHRLIWKLNLASLKKIVGKRGCWILQLGLWKPIIMGMIEELCEKVSPIFRELIVPPCYNAGKFTGCHFCENNYARIIGKEDEIPPCPIFILKQDQACDGDASKEDRWKIDHRHGNATMVSTKDQKAELRFQSMLREYQKFWGSGYFALLGQGPASGNQGRFFLLK